MLHCLNTLEGADNLIQIYLSMLETSGQKDKFTELYNIHKKRLTFVAIRYLSDKLLAEDVVHETFIAAIENKNKVFAMDNTEFMKWSYIVVKHKCHDIKRRAHRKPELLSEDIDDMPEYDNSVEEKMIQQDTFERIVTHVGSLGEINRRILEMKYVLEMPMREIADELGFTVAQVNSRIARARAKVKMLTESELFGDEHI